MAKKRYYSRPKIEIVTMDVDELMEFPETSLRIGTEPIKPIHGSHTTGNIPSGSGNYDDLYGGDESAKGGSVWDIWE